MVHATNSVLNGNDSISVQNVTGGTMSGVAITTTGASGVTAASNTYTSTGDWNNGTLTVGNNATLINFLGNTASLTSGGNVSVSDAQTGFITMNGANGTSTITTLTGSNVEQVASHTTNITNANGGEVHGGTVNMLGQMNGVTFDSTDVAMTIENVQTNLVTAPQDVTFLGSDIDVELPNPGIVTFTTSSSAESPIRFTQGPADTQETLTGNGNSWTAVGTSDTRSVNDLITIVVGGVTLYNGVTSEFLLNFVDTSDTNITWQARGVPTVTDNSGVFTFQYQGLFKRTQRFVTVGVGAVGYTVVADDGSNNTDRILFVEDAFNIIVNNPLTNDYINSILSVEYVDDGGVTQIKSTSDGSGLMFSQVETTVGNVLKITHTGMTTGGVYDWGYLEYTVPTGIPKNGTITSTPVQLVTSIVDSTASPLATTSATATWDSTANQLILSVTGIYQEP